MKNTHFLAGLVFSLVLFAAPPLTVADDHMDYQWTIKVDGKSSSAGKIAIKLTSSPNEDGSVSDPVTVEVMVADKTKRKDIQATIKNNFRATLGDERYTIRTQGSDRVSVKANDKTPWFSLELTNNTVQGVSMELKH